jgi:hypothetical protein
MSRGSKRRRQSAVVNDSYCLEDRVILSSIGPASLPAAHSQVGTLMHLGDDAQSRTRADSTVHVARHHSGHPNRPAVPPTANRWSWLADTYWFVPTSNLAAVLFDSSSGTLVSIGDQTVFQITGYRDGYFCGKTVTQLGSSSPTGSPWSAWSLPRAEYS